MQTTQQMRKLGTTDIEISPLGVGVWAWGDKGYWGYGTTYSKADITAAYKTSRDAGINLYDTAELYGRGESEKLLGEISRADGRPVIIASKFALYPWRFKAEKLQSALNDTLNRLKIETIDLYQIHWPLPTLQIPDLMDELAKAYRAGKVRAVGVSNYSANQMLEAHALLGKHGIPLASNQVQFSLIHRQPEANGVLRTCQQLKVTLLAYSPLAQGLLTGKFDTKIKQQLAGSRRFLPNFNEGKLEQMRPLIGTLQQVARKYNQTVESVALNWLMSKDELVTPIPGAKTGKQAAANAAALGWQLSPDDVQTLDAASSQYMK
jgi:aryl-alcohol dehydrogenase-like predicted oxidoreductase